VSDQSQGQGWWLASDGKWYPPSSAGRGPVDASDQGWWIASDGKWHPREASGELLAPPAPAYDLPFDTGPTRSRRPWYARWWSIGLAVFFGLGLLGSAVGGGEDDDGEEVEAASEPLQAPEESEKPEAVTATTERVEPEPAPERAAEGSYGSDPQLDRLQDQCGDGDTDACDQLFWDSPLGSEYEDYAQAHGGGSDNSGSDLPASDEISDLALQIAWEGMSLSEQLDVCTAFEIAPTMSYEAFSEGFGSGGPSFAEFDEFFSSVC
jgi:hypothetical protein